MGSFWAEFTHLQAARIRGRVGNVDVSHEGSEECRDNRKNVGSLIPSLQRRGG